MEGEWGKGGRPKAEPAELHLDAGRTLKKTSAPLITSRKGGENHELCN